MVDLFKYKNLLIAYFFFVINNTKLKFFFLSESEFVSPAPPKVFPLKKITAIENLAF